MTLSLSQDDPRANQKARTRAAIIRAAQELRREGATPTVADAAERAQVSRATAYRYFPTQEAMLVELEEVSPGVVPVEEMLGALSTDDVEERLLRLLETFGPIVLAEETQLRRALRVYQDTWLRERRNGGAGAPTVREGRRTRWLDEVLEPLELPDERKRRLRAALALTVGIDSIVIMKDVCRLDDEEALATLRWAAEAILRAGMEERGDGGSATADE
jgi:AcrR family transcriptional regulator